MNYNYITQVEYQAGNQMRLEDARQKSGFQNFAWLTFVQARGAGLKVKRGSKAVKILCVSHFTEIKNNKEKKSSMARPAFLFNFEQCTKI